MTKAPQNEDALSRREQAPLYETFARAVSGRAPRRQNCLASRLPVRQDVQFMTYSRPPTACEILFGYGASHYRTFTIEQACHKGTRVLKHWLIADDGQRYYR